jgi:hypothetical protein
LAALVDLPLESTVGVRKSDQGWVVAVEMLEKRSIPDGQDVLATYETTYGEDEQLISFQRCGMRKRADVGRHEDEA